MSPASLDELATKYGTDKRQGVTGLAPIYERYVSGWRDDPVTVLEIGVFQGASLRMWAEYFAQGKIFGIDFDPVAREHEGPRTSVLVGDQTDLAFLDEVAAAAGGSFDLIVDDGGHKPEQQLASLYHLWPRLKPGGVYAIEDLHTSYLGRWGGGWRRAGTTVEALKAIVDDVNQHYHRQPVELGELESLHVYLEFCVLVKRSPASPVRSGDPTQEPSLQIPDHPWPDE